MLSISVSLKSIRKNILHNKPSSTSHRTSSFTTNLSSFTNNEGTQNASPAIRGLLNPLSNAIIPWWQSIGEISEIDPNDWVYLLERFNKFDCTYNSGASDLSKSHDDETSIGGGIKILAAFASTTQTSLPTSSSTYGQLVPINVEDTVEILYHLEEEIDEQNEVTCVDEENSV